MTRTPIAITGAACLLPGAPDLASFSRLVLDGLDAVGEPPEGRFGVPNGRVRGSGADQAWSLAGGYVAPGPLDLGTGVPDVERLDLLTRWLLHCSRIALRDSAPASGALSVRTGAVFGNLSFPTDGMAQWGQGLAAGTDPGDPRNHFMSGLPAQLVGKALGLDAGTTCLDAACASSLYALKLACDALAFGRADRMVAGAVQRADSLFLHVGFCRLGAMSKTGQSRPFHAAADGLVPGEGCVVFTLRRLADAVAGNEPILGVIRGIGLSNDGRGKSLLAPSSEGQVRAMRSALGEAGWKPDAVQLFECHATGTPTGDRVELESLRAVYPGGAIGSLKSNLGHLITAAGAAGLLKVLIGMREGTMPPTLHGDVGPEGVAPFTLLHQGKAWEPAADGVRRAAVSAFGFGGNNGHLLVEDWAPGRWVPTAVAPVPRRPLAVLALAEQRGGDEVVMPIAGLRSPPADISTSLAQQALALALGREAWETARLQPERSRVGLYVGMACDGRITRWGHRWRLLHSDQAPPDLDAIAPPLRAEDVVGTMPNIVANRLGVQLDAAGPGFTLSAEELSGLRALDAAWDALERREIDVAVVGAVDVASDPRALAARAALGRTDVQADAGVMLVLTRGDDAAGGRILATLSEDAEGPVLRPRPPRHGAADAMVVVADAVHRSGDHLVQIASIGGERASLGVRSAGHPATLRATKKAGASVAVPMHPPEWTAQEPALKSEIRILPRPPALVPVSRSGLLAPPGVAAARPLATTGAAAAPPSAAPALPSQPAGGLVSFQAQAAAAAAEPSSAGWEPGFAAWRRAVGATHGGFLEGQAAMHAAFLQAHSTMTSALFQAARSGTIPLEAPEIVAPAAVQTPPPAGWRPGYEPAPAPAQTPSAPPPTAPKTTSGTVERTVVTRAEPNSTPVPTKPKWPNELAGPHLSRAELEMGANGSITTIFGPQFAELDRYTRVVRMPEPPLLLADRVLGIEGPALVLGKGRIITETDITADAWYLHDGRMPGGLMIESGQADLLLGSWQGIDFLNKSERIYRLLGCTLTYKGELPKLGETLRYDIRIDQHAKLGDVRMFFFRYDCWVGDAQRLSVTEGQAGFFTDEELSNSGGCLWDAVTHEPGDGCVDAPEAIPARTSLDRVALERLGKGDVAGVFGPNFARAQTHTYTPRLPHDRLLLFDRAELELAGGPWGRGYVRAELDIRPDLWFFHGHFFNDPCMPGTLMFDGCLQAMYLLLAARGHTLRRDGWRFEPVKDVPFKLRCRGQVTPKSKKLVYEVFVTEVRCGPVPRLVAQVLCTVDGLKCFHADPMAVELVPDWPLARPELAHWLDAGKAHTGPPPAYDWPSLLACAWGRPSDAFGAMYARYDSPRRVARLPGPPYHFMSRVRSTTGQMGAREQGSSAVVEYDVPPEAWYFGDNGHPVMPYAVLLEAALQPCGWLASWTGCALADDDFLFRNLDGSTTIHREITPRTGMITTTTTLTRISKSAGMVLVTFVVAVADAEGPILDMNTVFGFFPPAAFENQVGVGSTEAERARLATPATPIDIPRQGDSPAGSSGRLRLLDRAFRCADGWTRGEMDVSPDQWFFKAHFFQDPVQPGSLGIEALLHVLQVAMVDQGLASTLRKPRFEPVANGQIATWKYRGQVVPECHLVQTEVRILETIAEPNAVLAIAEGHLWVDGKKIYTMPRFAMRLVEDDRPAMVRLPVPVDHRPTWTLPATAMLTMAMHALAHTGADVLEGGVALRWLSFPDDQPRDVPIRHLSNGSVILGPEDAPYFKARVGGDRNIPEVPALVNAVPDDTSGNTIYASGALFHGPSFQALDRFVARGDNGATALLRALLAPDVLLDGMTHPVPHGQMDRWFDVAPGKAAYPACLRRLVLTGPLPSGATRVEARALALEKGRPVVGLWLFAGDTDTCIAYQELEEVLLPKGRIGEAPPEVRRRFLMGEAVPEVSLSRITGGEASLSRLDVAGSDWLPGTVAAVYGTDVAGEIAVRELAATVLGGHPRQIRVEDGRAWSRHRPLRSVDVEPSAAEVNPATARLGGVKELDLGRVTRWWQNQLGTGEWAGEAVLTALAGAWLAEFRVVDPDALAAIDGPVLFLANHESYLESVLFTAIAAAICDRPIRALAKVEHQTRWLGKLHAAMTSYPGHRDPPRIAWFDQDRPASLRPVLDAVPRNVSLLAHVEGTRQLRTGAPIEKVSSLWTDLALERGCAIVPVAFRGGVNGARTDIPIGPQVHVIGAPILAATLAALPYAERRQRVATAIDELGTDVSTPEGEPRLVEAPGAELLRVIEASGALAAADAAWAARVRAIGA